jgi:hypothetical protein
MSARSSCSGAAERARAVSALAVEAHARVAAAAGGETQPALGRGSGRAQRHFAQLDPRRALLRAQPRFARQAPPASRQQARLEIPQQLVGQLIHLHAGKHLGGVDPAHARLEALHAGRRKVDLGAAALLAVAHVERHHPHHARLVGA